MGRKFRIVIVLSALALLLLGTAAISKPAPVGAKVPAAKTSSIKAFAAHDKSRAARLRHARNVRHAVERREHASGRPIYARLRPGERLPQNSVPTVGEQSRSGYGWPALVTEARKYIGTNPTARSRLWCATFMNFVLAKVGYAGTGSDAAKSFASYGRRIYEPRVGAIAVLTRGKRGGHVGIVTGIDANGNPVIISGNHGKRVGEGPYPRSRVIAYVMPNDRTSATRYASAVPSVPGRANDAQDEGATFPITELLAAIDAEIQNSRNRPQNQPQLPPPQAAPGRQERIVQQAPGQPAYRTVQQPQPQQRVAQFAPQPQRSGQPVAARPIRELPLDPRLAKLFNVQQRDQRPVPMTAPSVQTKPQAKPQAKSQAKPQAVTARAQAPAKPAKPGKPQPR